MDAADRASELDRVEALEHAAHVEHRWIPTNGIRLHVVTAGPPGGRPVVLLHGFPELWYGWRKQIPALAGAGFRLVMPDQRGYNLSDKPRGVASYRLDALAADILGLLDALGYARVQLVGHDWGATVGWYLATLHPRRIERLVVLNVPHPALLARALRHSPDQLRRSWYMFVFQLPKLPEWLLERKGAQALERALLESSRRGSFSDEALAVYREAWRQPGALTGMLSWYRSAVRGGWAPFSRHAPLPRVTVPTLLLWGADDRAIGRALAEQSLRLCENGRLLFFEQATHWVQHDESAAVNAALIAFLSGSTAADRRDGAAERRTGREEPQDRTEEEPR